MSWRYACKSRHTLWHRSANMRWIRGHAKLVLEHSNGGTQTHARTIWVSNVSQRRASRPTQHRHDTISQPIEHLYPMARDASPLFVHLRAGTYFAAAGVWVCLRGLPRRLRVRWVCGRGGLLLSRLLGPFSPRLLVPMWWPVPLIDVCVVLWPDACSAT